MAGSDKNTRGSNAGRSEAESSQPISETESREVAGQLLTSLKSASSVANALSHEAKLGMAVITILFFAFCFLVYHKLDLHQRQLTQASIASKAESPDTASGPEAASTLMSGNVTGTATDPLPGKELAVAGQEDLPTFANGESPVTASGFDTSATMEFSEPADSEATNTLNSAGDLVADNASPAASVENQNSQDAGDAFPELALSDSSAAAINESRSASSANTDVADFNAGDEGASVTSTPEFGPLESTDSVPQPQDNEFPLSALDGTENLPASERQPMVANDEASDGITLPAANSADDTAEITFDSTEALTLSETAATETPATETELSEPPMLEEPVASAEKEPVLVAMLDPQESSGSENAGDTYSDRVSSFAPLDDASANNETPSFESAAEQELTDRTVAQQSSGFGSRGFDAVTQPGGRTNRNSTRTAGGSGADGKFSLAAFNSQNAESEPAPDDGTTYEYTVVKNDENYSKISKRVYGTTRYFSALAVFNQHRIAEPKHMRPGMIVLTPSKEILEERYPQLFVDSKPRVVEPAEFLLLEDGSPAYRVGERETLSEISKRFLGRSSRWVEILRLNQSNVKDPNKLKPGTILALPADATEVNVVP